MIATGRGWPALCRGNTGQWPALLVTAGKKWGPLADILSSQGPRASGLLVRTVRRFVQDIRKRCYSGDLRRRQSYSPSGGGRGRGGRTNTEQWIVGRARGGPCDVPAPATGVPSSFAATPPYDPREFPSKAQSANESSAGCGWLQVRILANAATARLPHGHLAIGVNCDWFFIDLSAASKARRMRRPWAPPMRGSSRPWMQFRK